ncbi:phasin family protein [Actinoplanes sp. CA-142083]|uniref:phasin family protein n=1 Tax=Actinoplanes sp. CA-142083 TaxID=3239903 RepID=UPI003D8D06B6
MPDAWRAYLEMALGLTETPRKRAQRAVGDLVNRGGATAVQLQGLVEDLLQAGMANREALTNIVRYEVDRALGVVGLATAEEVTELNTRVRELEKQLKDAQEHAVQDGGAPEAEIGGTRLEKPAPLPKKVAKKAVAKKAVKATPNAMPTAGTTPAGVSGNVGTSAPAPVTATASVPVKKVPVKKVAKKTVAKKTVAKKAVKKAAPEPLSAPIAEALPPAEAAALAEVAAPESPTTAPATAPTTAPTTAPATAPAEPSATAPAKKAVAKKAPAKKAAPVKKSAPPQQAAPSTEPEN